MEIDHQKRIEDLIKGNRVFVFMKGEGPQPECRFSAQVVDILNKYGVKFGWLNVLKDEEMRQAIKDYGAWPTVPQVYVEGKFIGGADVLAELDASGELKVVLG